MITESKIVGFLQRNKMSFILMFLFVLFVTSVASADQSAPPDNISISWANPSDITYGIPLSNVQLNANPINQISGASVSGNITYDPPAGTKLNANLGQNLTVVFKTTDSNYNPNTISKSVQINVLRATPNISWSNPADLPLGDALGSDQLNAIVMDPNNGSIINGTYNYIPKAGIVLSGGQHTLHVDFTPNDTNNYFRTSKDVTINVVSSSISSFKSDVTSGISPLKVQFTDTSSGSPTAWSWNFGDGITSNEQNPQHIFTGTGSYSVSLDASNAFGTDTSVTAFSTIHVYDVPVASFEYYPSSGESPLCVQFRDTSLVPQTDDGNVVSWCWNFGDGATSNDQNPTHTYILPYPCTAPVTYCVTLKISVNSFGTSTPESTSTVISHVTVYPVPLAANFITDQDTGLIPLTVEFTDHSDGDPILWHWDFGDGTTSNSQNPRHTYYKDGSYIVCLQVSNNQGTVSSKTSLIYVNPYPVAYFITDVISGTAPLTVHFTDNSTGSPIAWTWDFDDGSISHYRYPTHTYYEAGTYKVTLAEKDAFGNSIPKGSTIINVYSLPVADFYSDLSSGVAPLTVQFTDKSTGNPTSWNWDFGDGTTSNHRNPIHKYTSPGTYTPTLAVTNSVGSSTTGNTINTGDLNPDMKGPSVITVNSSDSSQIPVVTPSADFYSEVTEGTAPFTVQFYDNSTSFTPTAWIWYFGDGSTSNVQNPQHNYSVPGVYTVTLSAGDSSSWRNITKVSYITVEAESTNSSNSTCSNSTSSNSDSSSGGGSSYGTATIVSSSGGSSSSGQSSGGMATSSSEPQSNVQSKVTDDNFIIAGNHVTYDFTRGTTPIDFLEFDANRTFGKVTTIVEQLKGRSSLASTDPEGKVINYMNIWVGNGGIVNENNIKNSNIEFRVSKNEVTQDKVSTVTLQRYADGKWNSFDTTKTGEDTQYIYYQAKTPGFSPFAITLKSESGLSNAQDNSTPQTVIQPMGMKNFNESGSNNNKEARLNSSTDPGNRGLSGTTTIIIVLIGILIIIVIGLIVGEKVKSNKEKKDEK